MKGFLLDCALSAPLCITFGVAAGNGRSPWLWIAFVASTLLVVVSQFYLGFRKGGRK